MCTVDLLVEFFEIQGKSFGSLEEFKDYSDMKQLKRISFSFRRLKTFLIKKGLSKKEADDIAFYILFEQKEEFEQEE